MTCSCDRCIRTHARIGWPNSEVPPVRRTWLGFELLRAVDVVAACGACSWTEMLRVGLHPVSGEVVA